MQQHTRLLPLLGNEPSDIFYLDKHKNEACRIDECAAIMQNWRGRRAEVMAVWPKCPENKNFSWTNSIGGGEKERDTHTCVCVCVCIG